MSRLVSLEATARGAALVLAGIFLVALLSYGVPAFVAGSLIQVGGLYAVGIGYLAGVVALAAIGIFAQQRIDALLVQSGTS